MGWQRNNLLASVSICTVLLAAAPARAASLQMLDQSEWWQGVSGLPSYVNMYLYVPDQLVAHPPIVVAPHHCQGNGPGTFSEMSSLVALADQNGFIMVFPEATGQNCWDAGSERALTHDGKGDTHAIVQMVRYTLSTYDGNADRVYSVGGSSGGIMTEALLGVYPDVFMAGVSLMGVPCGCWAEGYNDVVGNPSNGTGQWSGPCAGGDVTKTGQEWGDLVRSYFPEYSAHRPRLQHWHGTADTTLAYANIDEDIKEWTNLLELSETPTGSDMPASGTTHQFWTNACGYTVYETFSLSGVGHAVPFNGGAVAEYFGLDESADGLDPETAACPGALPGGGDGGTQGAGGSGGMSATNGAGGASTGAGGAGGAMSTVTGGGGLTGGTPTTASANTAVTGGGAPSGGAATTGGGGASTTGGSAPSGTVGTGGVVSSVTATGDIGGIGGDSSSAGASATGDSGSEGCGCVVVGRATPFDPKAAGLLGLLMGWTLGRRRRRARRPGAPQ